MNTYKKLLEGSKENTFKINKGVFDTIVSDKKQLQRFGIKSTSESILLLDFLMKNVDLDPKIIKMLKDNRKKQKVYMDVITKIVI